MAKEKVSEKVNKEVGDEPINRISEDSSSSDNSGLDGEQGKPTRTAKGQQNEVTMVFIEDGVFSFFNLEGIAVNHNTVLHGRTVKVTSSEFDRVKGLLPVVRG